MPKFSFYMGATASSWLLAVLVILVELVKPFKELLAATFTHHWIGKAVLVALAFVVFGFLLKEKNSIGNFSDKDIAWKSTLGALTVIFLFNVLEFFV